MKLLHTSDWHLGRSLYGRKRDDEFARFLQWMVHTVHERQIDVLIVAGDVFDTTTPSNRAQTLYYEFLQQIVASNCHHVVIVAGNHDSPTFLNAPSELLKALDVHVIGHAQEDLSRQLVILNDSAGQPKMIVCAIPYLRDRDVRTVVAGETMQDKDHNLMQGIRDHYEGMAELVRETQARLNCALPVVATGHLYAAGSQTVEGDGVRDLYIGSLGQVHANIFSDVFDYVALGHLHVPQIVGGQERIRYSGSPLPMGFGESRQQKILCEVMFEPQAADSLARKPVIEKIPVPVFQQLHQIRGDLASILAQLETLKQQDEPSWVEVLYEGDEVVGDLRQRIEQAVDESRVEVLRVKLLGRSNPVLTQMHEQESLDDLTPVDVFERCLESHQVAQSQRSVLRQTYQETLALLQQADQDLSHGEVQ